MHPAPAELARHYFAARELAGPEPAIRYGREAARRAMASFAWEDAARELERAVEADRLREPPDPDERTELLLELGEAHLRAGHAAARAPFAEAARLARGRSPTQLAQAAIGYGGRYFEAGVVDDELLAMLEGALHELPAEERALRARVLARLAESLHFAARPEAALAVSEDALALARAGGDADVLAAALLGRHTALLHVAFATERLAVSTELVTLARRRGSEEDEMRALHARIFDLLTLSDASGAQRDCERLAELALAHRQPLFEHLSLAWQCTFAQLDGSLEEAQRLAAQAFALRERLATRDAEAVFAGQLFTIRRAQGRLHELLPVVEQVTEDNPALSAWRAALPLVHLAAGDRRRAQEELTELVATLDDLPPDFFWLPHVAVMAEAAAGVGDAAAATRLHELLAPYRARFAQVGHATPLGAIAPLLEGLERVISTLDGGGPGAQASRRR